MEVCQYTTEQGPMDIYMKVFDYDIDKGFLKGHFKEATEVAAEVRKEFKNFGVLADLSHFPLCIVVDVIFLLGVFLPIR
jgi:hypothetical protein